ncbi:MAG: ribosomal protein S18-alanine N-acetyltransferase [Sarcina sp.]|nr:ribosomal protein S18-alanine N-acetyltransferase [Sarcina sp.]
MSVIVRRMREEDIPQAVEIEKAAFTRPWSKSIFKATLLLPYAAYYVAVEQKTLEQGEKPGLDQDRIVGICGVKKIFEEGEISNVAVHPDYRGRGVSRRMLEMLIREAREGGVESFTLEVRAGNRPAIRLYESFGFRTEGIRPRFYDHPVEDGLIMWLRR